MKQLQQFVGSLPEIRDKIVIPSNSHLSKLNKDIIIAFSNHPKISEYNDKNFVANEIIKMIGHCFFYVGLKAESMNHDDLMLYYQIVVKDIYDDFDFLTLQEVKMAFTMGVRGNLGDGKYFGLNPATFYSFLKLYCTDIRPPAALALKSLTKPEDKKLTPEEVNQQAAIWLQTVYKSWDYFVESNDFDFVDLGDLLYRRMRKQGLLKVTLSECRYIWKTTEESIAEKHHKRNARNASEANQFRQIVDYMFNGIGNMNVKQATRFLLRKEFMRQIIIHRWHQIKNEGKNLKNIFVLRSRKSSVNNQQSASNV